MTPIHPPAFTSQLAPSTELDHFQTPMRPVASLFALGLAAVGVLVVLRVARALQRKLRIARGLAPLSGPRGVFLLGNMPAFARNRDRIYDFLEEKLKEHGGRMKMPWHLFFDGAIYITDPADVKHVLATNFDNYVKPQGFLDAFQEVFEHSFFAMNHHSLTADGGAKWRLQRKVAARVFTTANFKEFSEKVFAKYAAETLRNVAADSSGGSNSTVCDMQRVSAQFTLRSIFDVAFGLPLDEVVDADEFEAHMAFVNEHCASRLFVKQHYKLLGWAMPSEYALRRHTDAIRAVADRILTRRLEEPVETLAARLDILSLFIKRARELETDSAQLLDVPTLRSIILTFIFAGRDTTAECITYALYAIARHPDAQHKIVSEIREVLDDQRLRAKATSGSEDRDPAADITFETVKRLKYLDAAVFEAVRLFPALPYNVKQAVRDDFLPDGTFVPAGVDVVYSPWFMGRNGAVWGSDPLVFRPERWLEMPARPSAFEFPAFQAGPRVCLGMNMAVLEAKTFLAVLLRDMHVRIAPGEDHERGYTLKSGLFMAGGLPLQLTPRTVDDSTAAFS